MLQAAPVIVLTGLCHEQQVSRQFFLSHVFRPLSEPLADLCHFSVIVKIEFSVCRFGEVLVRESQPGFRTQNTVQGACFFFKEISDSDYPVPASADRLQQGAFQRAELFWKFGVCPFQKESGPPVDYVLARKKEAEARLKIMVLRDIVVETEAFRSASGKTGGKERQKLGEVPLKHRPAVFFKICSG